MAEKLYQDVAFVHGGDVLLFPHAFSESGTCVSEEVLDVSLLCVGKDGFLLSLDGVFQLVILFIFETSTWWTYVLIRFRKRVMGSQQSYLRRCMLNRLLEFTITIDCRLSVSN